MSDISRLDRHRARIGEDVRRRGEITANGAHPACGPGPSNTRESHHLIIARTRLVTSRLARPIQRSPGSTARPIGLLGRTRVADTFSAPDVSSRRPLWGVETVSDMLC
ncbi:MAG: hypothetical protein KAS72_00985, partial [Phycisphaerales bacterium]|nr:hypothetical protein [Phycisphaerales bacterium]